MKKYTYKEYDPIFVEQFNQEKEKLTNLFGKEVEIEHIGSTSVPGLGGKGIVDVILAVEKEQMKKRLAEILESGIPYLVKISGDGTGEHYKAEPVALHDDNIPEMVLPSSPGNNSTLFSDIKMTEARLNSINTFDTEWAYRKMSPEEIDHVLDNFNAWPWGYLEVHLIHDPETGFSHFFIMLKRQAKWDEEHPK